MDLINRLKGKIEQLEKEEYKDEKEYEYFNWLNKETVFQDEIMKFTQSEMLKILLVLERKDVPFLDIDIMIRGCRSNIDNKDLRNLKIFIMTIDTLKNTELLNFIVENNTLNINQITKRFNQDNNSDISEKIEIAKKIMLINKYGIELFDNKDNILMVIKIMCRSDMLISANLLELILCKSNCGVYDILNNLLDETYITEITNKIKTKVIEMKKQRNDFVKITNHKIALYKNVITTLEKLNTDEIIDYTDEMLNILDEELSYEYIKTILEHNRSVYTKLKSENLKNGYYNNIEKLFLKNNISLDNLDIESKNMLLKNCKVEELEPIVNQLSIERWNWLNTNNPYFASIILNTSKEVFDFLNYCLDNKIISIDTIRNNIEILIIEKNKNLKPLFLNFKANVYFFRKLFENIDNRFIKNENALLVDNKTILNIYEICKKYQLNFRSENVKFFSGDLFTNDKILDDLDSFIELGFADYIKENPHILKNESKDIVTRLSIMLNIGLDPYSKENRLHSSIINGKNFYISQEELCNYELLTVDKCEENKYFNILNNNTRMNISFVENEEIVKYLDQMFKKDELSYIINDYYISRNKFLRNFECLINNGFNDCDAIYASLVYNSCLDDITIEYIKNTIKSYKEVKQLKLVN